MKAGKAKEPAAPAPKRKRADWEAVERDYRTGKFTLRELEEKHGVNNGTIARKAEKHGWTKDLAAAVRQATNAKVIAQTLQQEGSKAQQNTANVVLAAADLNARVIQGHRSDLNRARAVALGLLEELKATALMAEERELIAELMAGTADEAKQEQARQAVRKALDVGNRIGAVKSLAEALTKLHAGERKAHALDDEAPPAAAVPTDLSAIPAAERQAAYLKLVSGT